MRGENFIALAIVKWIVGVKPIALGIDVEIGNLGCVGVFDKHLPLWDQCGDELSFVVVEMELLLVKIDLIEELAADQIEVGIMISRFNQRGSFRKELFDGGNQERGLAQQYRDWAAAARNWPRTKALLERIAEDWDRQAKRADTEARLDQVRDG